MPSGVSLAKMAKKRENFASQKREGKEEEAVAKRNYDLGKSRRRKHGEWRVAILSSCIFLRKFFQKRVRFPPVLPLIFSTHAPLSHSRKTGFILYFSFIRPPISGRFGSTSVVCSNYSNLDRPSVSPTNFSRHFESRWNLKPLKQNGFTDKGNAKTNAVSLPFPILAEV